MGKITSSLSLTTFLVLPILTGTVREYGVFIVHRYREALHTPRRAWRRWDVSDRALLLCGFVTSSSFGFYWALARHEGLKSLGLVMALGTACIYLATIMVVRPLLRWWLHRKGVYREIDAAANGSAGGFDVVVSSPADNPQPSEQS